jgi:hypothetical protein
LADLFEIDILVETGTFQGETVQATKGRFKHVYSIEIFEPLAIAATKRFSRDKNVSIILGDSAKVLPTLIASIQEPILFWLDGHFSGPGTGGKNESPILAEVASVFERTNPYDVLVIDDVRLFGVEAGYPSLNQMMDFVGPLTNAKSIIVNDTIIIIPRCCSRARSVPSESTWNSPIAN